MRQGHRNPQCLSAPTSQEVGFYIANNAKRQEIEEENKLNQGIDEVSEQNPPSSYTTSSYPSDPSQQPDVECEAAGEQVFEQIMQ